MYLDDYRGVYNITNHVLTTTLGCIVGLGGPRLPILSAPFHPFSVPPGKLDAVDSQYPAVIYSFSSSILLSSFPQLFSED